MNSKNGITWTESNQEEKLQRESLNNQILDIAGEYVNIPFSNINTKLNKYFSEHAIYITDKNINTNLIFPFSKSAANSSFLVKNIDEEFHLYYGYFMNNEGVWSEHCWCVDPKDNTIIESTMLGSCYFGINLTKLNETEKFIERNLNKTIENHLMKLILAASKQINY
jgi:hypothetical protein